eukprot:TRINITY_DN2702_c0_g1_i1.p1 TRINITY_DN2702_c0_g1~~TRINITY_DN2702_c0_g1_i1.p1  ORF type:complete len:169 (-),score=15.96 TRINITY_DN2702_c0_g1_i1:219-725(-)
MCEYVARPVNSIREDISREISGEKHAAGITISFHPLELNNNNEVGFGDGALPNLEEGDLAIAISLIERVVTETLSDCLQRGFSGRKLTGLRVQVDGVHLTPYASKAAFRLASHKAFYTALRQAETQLVEPVMQVEVFVPQEFAQVIVDDAVEKMGGSKYWIVTQFGDL